MKYDKNSKISEIVAQNYGTAAVFKLNKIDFCCNGNRTLQEAANKRKIDVDFLINALHKNKVSDHESNQDFNSWPVDLLANYIERIHHSYVEEKLPVILEFLDKIRKVHGETHPELYKVYDLFKGATFDLIEHMRKEELILFPYAQSSGKGKKMENEASEELKAFVKEMMKEHDKEGDRFREIRELTNDYVPPVDACTTYRAAFSMLEEFEDNLHKHVHLENNVLCPKLVEMEVCYV